LICDIPLSLTLRIGGVVPNVHKVELWIGGGRFICLSFFCRNLATSFYFILKIWRIGNIFSTKIPCPCQNYKFQVGKNGKFPSPPPSALLDIHAMELGENCTISRTSSLCMGHSFV
jgi:hypothetical protein